MTIAAHDHHHHIHVMTRFRGQVLSRAGVLLAASALTWAMPGREGTHGVDAPARWLGSAVTEAQPVAGLLVLLALVAAGYAWQRLRPADMGALAWVVAGGVLAFVSLALVVAVGSGEGPVYWWLGVGVVVTSMTLQVLAALAGHALAVLAARRHEAPSA